MSLLQNKFNYKQVPLPGREYARVMSALNDVYDSRLKGRGVARVPIETDNGTSLYTVLVNGFGDYVIVGKEKLR